MGYCSAVLLYLKGFRATWKEVTSSGTLVEGSIKSPDFPNNYPNNKDQVWDTSICCFKVFNFTNYIQQEWDLSAPGGSKIQLTFNSFDIEDDASCSYDYVQVGVDVSFS